MQKLKIFAKGSLLFLLIPAFSLPISLLIHELSHLVFLFLSKGTMEGFSIGTLSFVSGYVSPNAAPWVAIAPCIVLPLISLLFIFLYRGKMKDWVAYSSLFLCMTAIINNGMNLFASSMIKEENERKMWDLALSMDFAPHPTIMFIICLIGLIVSLLCILYQIKRLVRSDFFNL